MLKYLKKYEDRDDEVIFFLKDLPSVKSAGNKIVRELYIYLFNDQALQLNRVQKIDDLTYRVQKEQRYFCLNCKNPIFFDDYITTTCEKCNWRNDLDYDPAADINPIIIKRETRQIAYPLIEESDLTHLPEKLKKSIEIFFKDEKNFSKEMYQNIYHNLYNKDLLKFEEIAKKYQQKLKLAQFFKNTNLFK